MLTKLFGPNGVLSKRVMAILITGQVITLILFWAVAAAPAIPKPWEVPGAFLELSSNGLLGAVLVSIALYLEALAISSVLSLLLAYASSIPFFSPIAAGWGKLRFLGLVGLPFVFTVYIHDLHMLKLALEVFSISVFMVPSMVDVVRYIPKEKYDLARTLQMNEWEVLLEVVVFGRADVMFDVIRQNAAIGWMMLPMIEGLFKSEGGIGAMLDIQARQFHLATIVAIQQVVLGFGLLQDYIIGWVKHQCCPYAFLLLERR